MVKEDGTSVRLSAGERNFVAGVLLAGVLSFAGQAFMVWRQQAVTDERLANQAAQISEIKADLRELNHWVRRGQ